MCNFYTLCQQNFHGLFVLLIMLDHYILLACIMLISSKFLYKFSIVPIFNKKKKNVFNCGYIWFLKVLRKKYIKENDFLIFDFTMKNMKENQI